jgi:hypothetical protein
MNDNCKKSESVLHHLLGRRMGCLGRSLHMGITLGNITKVVFISSIVFYLIEVCGNFENNYSINDGLTLFEKEGCG